MDIYRFTKNDTHNDFIRWGKPKLNPLEMAFLVYHSEENPLLEKHDAYRELLSDYPDIHLDESTHNKQGKSLHQCLRAILVKEEYLIDRFYADEPNVTYQAYVDGYYSYGHGWESAVYDTFTELWDNEGTFGKRNECDKEFFDITVKKIFTGSGDYIWTRFDLDDNLLDVSDNPEMVSAFRNEMDDPEGSLTDYSWKRWYDELVKKDSNESDIVYVGRTRRWNKGSKKIKT